jgi:hypothetical protein
MMGRFIKGIMGGFSGKVGNIIGGTWRGISYMRSLSDRRNHQPTERQIMQRERFAFAVRFLQPIHPVIKLGYRNQANQKAPINVALAHVIKHVVEGDYPDYRINYSSLEIAKGILPAPKNPVLQVVDGQLNVSWRESAADLKHYGDNHVVLLVLGEGLYPSYSIGEFSRSDLQATLPLPAGAAGTVLHCYLTFLHASENSVSNSYYAGSVELP